MSEFENQRIESIRKMMQRADRVFNDLEKRKKQRMLARLAEFDAFPDLYGYQPEDQATAWNGEGLPPVGCECEAVWLDLPDGGDRDFTRVLIKGYYDYGGGFKRVWFGVMPDDEDVCRSAAQCDFRPVRTKEQREREEMESEAINVANRVVGHESHLIPVTNMVRALYDAGMLRKGDA